MPPRKKKNFMDRMNEFAPMLAYGGSLLATAVLIVSKLATKEYVDERDKYTLEKSTDHADQNRNANLLEIRNLSADVKSIATKTDILLDMKQRELEAKK